MSQYSVLMSVYKKEEVVNLRTSVESMMNQTLPPDDFVLYCDGTLTDELYQEIERLRLRYPILNVVYNDVSLGLGKALNNAISYCKNDIIARMDSDDIAKPNRMENQMTAFIKYSADIVSAPVEEFSGSTDNIINVKNLPETDEEIKEYSKRRNPFNHPCTCFRLAATRISLILRITTSGSECSPAAAKATTFRNRCFTCEAERICTNAGAA